MTTNADIPPGTTRDLYRIDLKKHYGPRPLPYWDTLSVDREAGTVTFSATLPARFDGDRARGRHESDRERLEFDLRANSTVSGSVRWITNDPGRDEPEDTEAYVQESDPHGPDGARRRRS